MILRTQSFSEKGKIDFVVEEYCRSIDKYIQIWLMMWNIWSYIFQIIDIKPQKLTGIDSPDQYLLPNK